MADKPKIKVLIVDDTKIGGRHIPIGTIQEYDPEVAQDRTTYAMLKHAGRIADATEENIGFVNNVIVARKLAKEAAAKHVTATTPDGIATAVVAALIEGGIIKAPKADKAEK